MGGTARVFSSIRFEQILVDRKGRLIDYFSDPHPYCGVHGVRARHDDHGGCAESSEEIDAGLADGSQERCEHEGFLC